MERTMSDLCYSFPIFNRVLAQAELMDRMIEKVGVSPLALIRCDGGASWLEARTRCIDCLSEQACRAWLASDSADAPDAPQLCPNAQFFNAIKSSMPSPGS